MKKLLVALSLFAVVLSGCSKYDDSAINAKIDGIEKRVTTLEAAVEALKAQQGKSISSVTAISTAPGGWKITFSDNTSIDIMNGTTTAGGDPVSPPMFELRTDNAGKVTLWVTYNGTTYTQVPGANNLAAGTTPPKFAARAASTGGGTSLWYNISEGYPEDKWIDTGFKLVTSTGGGSTATSPVADIVKDPSTGMVTIEMSDGSTYTFPETTTAITRIEVLKAPTSFTGTTPEEIIFRVNPSDADISLDAADWIFDLALGTRAYATPDNDLAVTEVKAVDGKEGQYVATVQNTTGLAITASGTGIVYALVYKLSDGVEVSSGVFEITGGTAAAVVLAADPITGEAPSVAMLAKTLEGEPENEETDTAISLAVTADWTPLFEDTTPAAPAAKTRTGEDTPWITLVDRSDSSGDTTFAWDAVISDDNPSFNIVAAENTTGSVRTANVTIRSGTDNIVIKVTQTVATPQVNVLDEITDAALKAAIVEQLEIDAEQPLTIAAAAAASANGELDLADLEIASAAGLQYFTGLKSLDISGNAITSLDVSKMAALEELNAMNNALVELTLGMQPNLTDIDVSNFEATDGNNALTTLDLSGLTALENLDASNNRLTSIIGLNKATALVDLRLGNDGDGNVSEAPTYFAGNALTTLNVTGLSLEDLDVNGNPLTAITGLGALTTLSNLRVSGTKLTALDLSANTDLETLEAIANPSLVTLKVKGLTNLEEVYANHNGSLTTLDAEGCTSLTWLEAYANAKMTSLKVTGCTDLETLNAEYSTVLAAITGLADCTALESLSIGGTSIASIALTANTALKSLYAQEAKLTTLDIAANTALTRLSVSGNPGMMMPGETTAILPIAWAGSVPASGFIADGTTWKVDGTDGKITVAAYYYDPAKKNALITAFTSGGSHTLTGNIFIYDAHLNQADVALTLDLAGFSIIGGGGGPFIFNQNSLTINDSDGEGRIVNISATNEASDCAVGITGTTIITGGTYMSRSGSTLLNYGTLTVNGADTKVQNLAAGAATSCIAVYNAHSAATTTLTGGWYSSSSETVYCYQGAVTITGGTYTCSEPFSDVDDRYFVLNMNDKQENSIVVKGGKYERFDPANSYNEPQQPSSLVHSDYKSVAVEGATVPTWEVVAK